MSGDGDVTLTLRNIRNLFDGKMVDPYEIEGKMLFKTRENGGQYPIFAEVFTRIAERFAKAKDPRKYS